MTDERPFVGGNVSDAVRVGDTVHRRAGPHSPAVHALLRHVVNAGLLAPCPIGFDEHGREVLTYLEGRTEVGWPTPQPEWVYSSECLRGAARLLRQFHDISATFVPPEDAQWRVIAPTRHEVICHNDWSPHNAIFREGIPVGMLDWDQAGPGSRAWDVARSAYSWIPLYPSDRRFGLPERATRLRQWCDAYGDIAPGEALETLIAALPFHATNLEQRFAAGDTSYAKLIGWNVPDRLRREAVVLEEQRAELLA